MKFLILIHFVQLLFFKYGLSIKFDKMLSLYYNVHTQHMHVHACLVSAQPTSGAWNGASCS